MCVCVCVWTRVRRVERMCSILIWWVHSCSVHSSSEDMQIRRLKRQVHGLSLTLLESDSNMDHNDAEQSFCLYSVNHVHILTEDNRLNH